MSKYVISDIHGCYDEFMELLAKINFTDEDILYILGDVVDRGPEPIKCLQYIMSKKNIKMILGNHEDFMIKSVINCSKSSRLLWFSNGGEITLSQYNKLSLNEQKKINRYLDSLPLYLIEKDCILVHAGIDSSRINKGLSLEENMKRQSEDDILWIREDFWCKPTNIEDKFIIFGHTPTPFLNDFNQDVIWVDRENQDKLCIDCGCVFGGQLCAVKLDDFSIIYVESKQNPQA